MKCFIQVVSCLNTIPTMSVAVVLREVCHHWVCREAPRSSYWTGGEASRSVICRSQWSVLVNQGHELEVFVLFHNNPMLGTEEEEKDYFRKTQIARKQRWSGRKKKWTRGQDKVRDWSGNSLCEHEAKSLTWLLQVVSQALHRQQQRADKSGASEGRTSAESKALNKHIRFSDSDDDWYLCVCETFQPYLSHTHTHTHPVHPLTHFQ